jgi:hypothetical protein
MKTTRITDIYMKTTRITGTLHEDISAFMIISHWILHRMRNVLDKSCSEKQNTHLMINNLCVCVCVCENHAIETACKNLVQLDRPQMLLQYSARVLHAEQIRLQRLQTHTQSM